jgi:phosphoribosyl 1,2-cyclic phosphodiesterase
VKIKFYGTRGSIPVSHKDFLEFGGNTTSIKITRDNGRIALLDAGSGIRNLGKDLLEKDLDQSDLFIAFSHFHWDHIQGFPFFEPAYRPDFVINILALGREREITNLEGIFKGQMEAQYFPVPMNSMGAKFNFLQVNRDKLVINDAVLRVIKQSHPGGSYGYRMEDNGKSLVILTDLEHGESVLPEIVEFCKGADLLVHEAQYTNEMLERYRGWGHSSFDQAMEVAEQAGVKKLVMTHHDPDHNDTFLTRIEKECQKRIPNCELARENREFIV